MTELLRRLSRLMLPLAALYCGPAASGEMLHHRSPHPLAALLLADGRVIAKLETPGGVGFFALSLHGDSTKLSRLPGYLPTPLEEQADMLPDGIVTKGKRDIAAAWLTGPTKRYDHGVLGDAIEASGLRVRLRDGSELSYLLSDDSVFEDRQVRLADLDGDGGDELVVVRSYPTAGAALAVFRPQGGEIVKVAETKPIGQPHRWLNPAAIADFDGDGYLEVAAVVTPHIGGTLIMLELRLNRLRLQWLHKKWSARGFSNHAIGSRIQDMATAVDWGRDRGRGPILHLPDAGRRALRQVFFADGTYRVRDLPSHQRPIITAIHKVDLDGDGWKEVVYGLDGGELVILRRSRAPKGR
ncbi:MAG: VCBS repeat-containing protein [Alphaproteobacteria bacterium]|nr:VCBS repeat-containing protein [Alphaproteobacteria bacterium]